MKDGVVLLDDNAIEVLSYWDLRVGAWQTVGFVAGSLDGVSRPIIAIGDARYVLRHQAPDLTENDTLFRHAFMRHLATAAELPIPPLLPRPDGHTYAVVEDGIYELQGWRDGSHYVSDDPEEDDEMESAARALGRLHQASADFEWQPHIWSAERSAASLAQAYCTLIRERSGASGLPETVAAGLARVADTCDERLDAAVEALETGTRPPELHIHGDYQPHNLAFSGGEISAIYDFDAARWERRVDELAYALLYFTGVRWDERPTVTPPLVGDGLDVPLVERFLAAYGDEAPPADGEARLLADALALTFPIVFANGVAEDLIFPDAYDAAPSEQDALARLHWADTFWLWLDRYRPMLAEAWERA